MHAIPWELHRSFLAVARHGSRHIDQLEQALGTALFTRSPQGLLATETALALVPLAEAMESAAAAMVRTASAPADGVAGVVRITASEIVGAEVLPAILAGFADAHPAIAFELHLSNQTEDLLRRDADIAVRMVRPTQTGLIARLLGETAIGLYAHRGYLQAHGEPTDIADIARFRFIGFDRIQPGIPALEQTGLQLAPETFSLRTDSDAAQLAALRAGYGIGGCQIGIARRESNLVRVLPSMFEFRLETWLVMHEDLRGSQRVRQVFDHLAQGLLGYLSTSR